LVFSPKKKVPKDALIQPMKMDKRKKDTGINKLFAIKSFEMKTLLAILAIFFSLSLKATKVTVYDYIIFEGDTLILFNSPLQPYFDIFPEHYPKFDQYFYGATKQYTAIYEFKDSVLHLNSIYTNKYGKDSALINVNVISEIFKGQHPVKMDWFSTCLVIGTEGIGHKRIYGNQKDEEFFMIRIENGKWKSKKKTSPRQIKRFEHKLFKEFVKTEEYSNLSEQYFNIKPKRLESILSHRILDLTSRIEIEKTPHNNK